MVGRKRAVPSRNTRRGTGSGNNENPGIYQQMLDEAGVSVPDQTSPERPLKRRRPGSRPHARPDAGQSGARREDKEQDTDDDEDEDEDIEFQDVVLPSPTVQTLELESDEDDEDEDVQLEDIDFTAPLPDANPVAESSNLELNLSAHQAAASPSRRGERRRPMTKEERDRRVDIHRTHLLCLLSHVARRNYWCNDGRVQDSLRPHLTDKTVNYLTPGSHLPQFGQAESLKNGLGQAGDVWKAKFEVTERGLRRALWAEEVEHLQSVRIQRLYFPFSRCANTVAM